MVDFDDIEDANGVTPAPTSTPTSFDAIDTHESEAPKTTDTGGPAESALTGVAHGITGGLSDVAATNPDVAMTGMGLTGMDPDAIKKMASAQNKDIATTPEALKATEEANPYTYGASNLVGMGATFGMLPASAPYGSTLWGKIGAGALKGAIENGAYSATEEISKALMGDPTGDPEAATSSAMWHIGAGTLLGGTFGGIASGGLAVLDRARKVAQASQFMADAGKKISFLNTITSLPEALHAELSEAYNSTKNALSDVWGGTNLKKQAIEKLAPIMHQGITDQNQQIAEMLSNNLKEMRLQPDLYDPNHTQTIQNHADNWINSVTNPDATPAQRFEATQTLKQQFQQIAKYDKLPSFNPLSKDANLINKAREMAPILRQHLEDPAVWGDAAHLQQGINSAFSNYGGKNSPLSDFERLFTTKVGGEPQVDPGKVATYANQYQKPAGTLKRQKLQNYIDAAGTLRDEIQNIHTKLGIENDIEPLSMPSVNETLKTPTKGGAFGEYMYNKGIPALTDDMSTRILGATVGSLFGPMGAVVGYHASGPFSNVLQKAAYKPLTNMANKYVVPATMTVLKSGEEMSAIPAAQEYAQSIAKGENKINKAVKSIFGASIQGGASAIGNNVSDKDKENLKNYIESGTYNKGMTNELNKDPKVKPPQAFARGGMVKPTPPSPMSKAKNPLETHFPEQNTMLSAAKSRINNYLNTVRPQTLQSKLPFDNNLPQHGKDRKYDQAIEMALNPAKIIEHIKDGTLNMDHMKHFTSMYPDIHNHLSKKITQEMMKNQAEGAKPPPYKVRQALSLFMTTPLDSTLTPNAIQSAQAALQPPLSPNQATQQGKPKKVTQQAGKGLDKGAKAYRTPIESAEADRSDRTN